MKNTLNNQEEKKTEFLPSSHTWKWAIILTLIGIPMFLLLVHINVILSLLALVPISSAYKCFKRLKNPPKILIEKGIIYIKIPNYSVCFPVSSVTVCRLNFSDNLFTRTSLTIGYKQDHNIQKVDDTGISELIDQKPEIIIKNGWFTDDVSMIQMAILNATVPTSKKQMNKVYEFNQKRFEQPFILDSPELSDYVILLWTLTIATLIIWYLDKFSLDTPLVMIFGVLAFFASLRLWLFIILSQERFLEISSQGIAIGANLHKMRINIDWKDIEIIRKFTLSEVSCDVIKSPPKTVSLEVHLKNGKHITIAGHYEKSPDELYEFLQPDLEKIANAYERMALGKGIETATREAGLPSYL